MRPSNKLHIGNYLGSAKGMIAFQDSPDNETFYMVADLHAITTPYDHETYQEAVRNVVLDYLAFGLDPEKSVVFVQSHVPEHVELSYLLSTVITIARLSHLPTYKEKVKQYPEANTPALLYYPVLMAADILIYKASAVPVGVDQEPHLEIAREIARKMNNQYGTDFPEPERFATEGEYIPSLTGEGKMSKSVEGSYIALGYDLETVKEKLAKTPTDEGKGDEVPKEGGVAALLALVEHFQGTDKRNEYEEMYQGEGIKYQELKNELAETIYNELKPIQKKREELEKNSKYVDKVLEEGAKKAQEVARETLVETKRAMGLI